MDIVVTVGNLEKEALKRRERLKLLKRKQTESENTSTDIPGNETVQIPKPKFRSYKPQDEKLQEHMLPEAKPGDVMNVVKDQLEVAKSKVVVEELDITNLAPRKPDWDLKRDVAKKLERLERRTQKAIAELIRDRLKQRQDDLAELVSMAPTNDNID